MRSINLNQLPKYSPWASRLLGLTPFKKSVRNLAKIREEYDRQKYGKCLTYCRRHSNTDIEEIKLFEKGKKDEDLVCISKKGKLYLIPFFKLRLLEKKILFHALTSRIKTARIVIELGSGYGYNLYLFQKRYPGLLYLGGEYSQNAIKLAKFLFRGDDFIEILPFNFYEKEWKIFDLLPKKEKAIIFTRHAVEQLPTALHFFETLKKYKNLIGEIIHLEPVYELHDPSLTLGLLRRSYTLINNYNTDLLSILEKAKSEVKILRIQYDILGSNPLNPTSLIQWRFKL